MEESGENVPITEKTHRVQYSLEQSSTNPVILE